MQDSELKTRNNRTKMNQDTQELIRNKMQKNFVALQQLYFEIHIFQLALQLQSSRINEQSSSDDGYEISSYY